MKRLVTLLVFATIPLGCDPDKPLCYECVKDSSGNRSSFCLPRADAKDRRDMLEADDYTCDKFKE